MKKLFLSFVVTLAAFALSAQVPKALSLKESSAKALETGLIDKVQKQRLDSLIDIYDRQRAEVAKMRSSLTREEISEKNVKATKSFNEGLREMLGKGNLSKWNALRKGEAKQSHE